MSNKINDEDLRKKVWEGYVPIAFTLASNEITSLQIPHPYYV